MMYARCTCTIIVQPRGRPEWQRTDRSFVDFRRFISDYCLLLKFRILALHVRVKCLNWNLYMLIRQHVADLTAAQQTLGTLAGWRSNSFILNLFYKYNTLDYYSVYGKEMVFYFFLNCKICKYLYKYIGLNLIWRKNLLLILNLNI